MTTAYAISDVLVDDEPKPVSATQWAVPTEIALDASGEHLVWHWSGAPEQWVRPKPMMLERFLSLHNAAPARIVAYANTWGVLGICPHGLPSSHNPTRDLDGGGILPGCEGIGHADEEGRWVFTEPIAAWRRFTGEARQIALMAARLRRLDHGWQPTPGERAMLPLGLRASLNRWLDLGAVKPAVVLPSAWLSGDPERALVPTIGAAGLFGTLALRLALACTGARGLAPCSSCGEWFVPSYAPREGQRQWCPRPDCQRAKVAAASRAYRARTRASRRP